METTNAKVPRNTGDKQLSNQILMRLVLHQSPSVPACWSAGALCGPHGMMLCCSYHPMVELVMKEPCLTLLRSDRYYVEHRYKNRRQPLIFEHLSVSIRSNATGGGRSPTCFELNGEDWRPQELCAVHASSQSLKRLECSVCSLVITMLLSIKSHHFLSYVESCDICAAC